eukprot:TRINITY_DN8938_c0_g1_i1.p1 TRINITY_DN8938_c0_g1~~TRINITY_DN8938_c0_g1_i1.p1  ORF type:complete len:584 (-),score=117.36 TRINITY_DN8938_c0_g1_i1:69-1820(-)
MACWQCPSCDREPHRPILVSLDDASQEKALRSAAAEYDAEQKPADAFEALLQELRAQHDGELGSLQQRLDALQTLNEELLSQIRVEAPSSESTDTPKEVPHQATQETVVQAAVDENAYMPLQEEPSSAPELVELSHMSLKKLESSLQEINLNDFEDQSQEEQNSNTGVRLRLGRFVEGEKFESIIGVLIMTNVLIMGVELQYQGMQAGHELGMPGNELPAASIWPWADDAVPLIQMIFAVFFALELILRVCLLRARFFCKALNLLDFFVVLASALEFFYAAFGTLVNPATLRLLRIVKVGRTLRVARKHTVLESLNLLTRCIAASLMTLFWSLCLLLVIQFIAGMILMSLVSPAIVDTRLSPTQQVDIYRYYGTFTRTMLTMFEVLFANWIPSCRVLVENVSEWFSIVFVLYRCIVGFAVLNVVNAVFIQQTMKIAQADNDLIVLQKQKAARSFATKLSYIFEQLDESGDGMLSYDEFCAIVHDDHMMALLSSLEIEANDLQELFKLLDNGDGELDCEEFVEGASRVKGAARGIDVVVTLTTVKRLERMVHDLARAMGHDATCHTARSSRITHRHALTGPGTD